MNPPKKPGRQNLPKDAQDNIIHKIQLLFSNKLSPDQIRSSLVSENWDLEKSLRKLHTAVLSVRTSKTSKKKSNPNKKASDNAQAKPLAKTVLSKKPKPNCTMDQSVEKGDWVIVNTPEQGVKKRIKKKKNPENSTKPSKIDLIKAVQDENTSAPSSTSAGRQARRTRMINNFEIIKHFGDTTNRITAYVREGIKVMILLRGCSGSGKSTFAVSLLTKLGSKQPQNHIFSADQFFINADNEYQFKFELLPHAHQWNQNLVKLAAAEGRSPIFVDNTNTRLWEMKEYARIAIHYGYILETLEPPTPWFFNEEILFRKSNHCTPRATIRKMIDRYEANLTGEDVIKNLNLSYTSPMVPPLGAMAALDSPLSKKHLKMISTRMENPVSQSTHSSGNKTLSSDESKTDVFVVGNNFTSDNSFLPSACDMSKLSLMDSANFPLDTEFPKQNTDFSSKESSDSDDSEDEDTCSSSSDDETESDSEDSMSTIGIVSNLEYVVILDSKQVVFQREHAEMKDVTTIEEFRQTTSNREKFIVDFEDFVIQRKIRSLNSKDDQPVHGASGDNQVSYLDKEVYDSVEPPCSFSEVVPECSSDTSSKRLYPQINLELSQEKENNEINSGPPIAGSKDPFSSNIKPSLSQPSTYYSTGNEGKEIEKGEAQAQEGGSCHSIDTLHFLFPGISKESLVELFGTSLTNIDWAIDLLRESGQKMVEAPVLEKIVQVPDHSKNETSVATGMEKLAHSNETRNDTLNNSSFFFQSGSVQNSLQNPNVQLNSSAKKNNSDLIDFTDYSSVGAQSLPVSEGNFESSLKEPFCIGDWDFKTQLPKELPVHVPKPQRSYRPKNTCGMDIATNTNYIDFEVLRKVNIGSNIHTSLKLLSGNNSFISVPTKSIPNTSILMLEKGTMTTDISTNSVQKSCGIERLALMFPQVPVENLEEIFERCQKDLDWAVGILLDSGQEMSELFTSLEIVESPESNDPQASVEESQYESIVTSPNSNKKKTKKKKIRMSKSDNELHKEIQNKIESNFFFEKDYKKKPKPHVISSPEASTLPPEVCNEEGNDLSDPEEDIVFMMDSEIILQLQARFGGLLRRNMIGDKTVVNLPLSLARQLHSYVMDSVYKHMEEEDIFTDEDEQLARKLQEEEMRSRGVPSLVEIMDEEVALRKSQKDLVRNSIASAFSKKLLIERFPKMDPSTLAMILEDTNHSLHQATNLLSSAGHTPADREEQSSSNSITKSKSKEKFTLSREEAIKQAEAYGDIASQLFEMRKDSLLKSKKAYRKGNYSVAVYYSDMARWYMERIEKSNSMAAKAILTGYEGWTTLDLHFLQVREALNVLDLFVDEVIRNLLETDKKRAEVFIITGRGLHSSGGQPKLKPAVQNRLVLRELRYCDQNPGMLKVIIPRTALTSYQYIHETHV